MARLQETYLSSDQMDYRRLKTGTGNIQLADAGKGLAAVISAAAAAGKATNRPVLKQSHAADQVVIGAITSVGKDGCNAVKKGRFVLQASAAGAAADIGKRVISTTTEGKVTHHASEDATKGQLAIIGFDNDTSTDGIGHHYLVECL